MEKLTQQTNCTMASPLAYQYQLTATIKDLINSSLGNIIAFLVILLATLMYSLILQDVNQKTYEFGMLRSLGWKKKYLVAVITLKSIGFSVFGLFLGILVAFIVNIGLREVIYIEALNQLDYNLTTASIVTGITFGFLTPLFANYCPIKESLSRDLRSSLDLTRSKAVEAYGIKMQRLEDAGISMIQFSLAALMIVVGIAVYYGVPLSFIKMNFMAAFLILGFILILVVIGMTFLCTLLFNYLERTLLWITLHTCCRKDRRIHSLILKQMHAHQIRNQKTSIIFTLTISFLLFSASFFKLMTTMIGKAMTKYIGADIYIFAWQSMLNEGPVSAYLDQMKKAEGQPVADYAFISM